MNILKGIDEGERPVVWHLHVYIEEEKSYIKENAKQFKSPATHFNNMIVSQSYKLTVGQIMISLFSFGLKPSMISALWTGHYMRDIRSAYYKQGKWNMKLELLSNDT